MPTKDTDDAEIDRLEGELRLRLASRLEELRRRENRSLAFLADAAKLTGSHLSKMLRGSTNITLRSIVKLAYALDVDAVELLRAGPIIKPKVKRGRPRTRRLAKKQS